MKLYRDNKSVIDTTHNPMQHDHIKHVEVDIHFIKEKFDSRLICTSFVLIKGQLADVLAKELSGIAFPSINIKLRTPIKKILRMNNLYSPV